MLLLCFIAGGLFKNLRRNTGESSAENNRKVTRFGAGVGYVEWVKHKRRCTWVRVAAGKLYLRVLIHRENFTEIPYCVRKWWAPAFMARCKLQDGPIRKLTAFRQPPQEPPRYVHFRLCAVKGVTCRDRAEVRTGDALSRSYLLCFRTTAVRCIKVSYTIYRVCEEVVIYRTMSQIRHETKIFPTDVTR